MTSPKTQRLGVLRVVVATYVAIWTAIRAPHLLETRDFAPGRLDPVGPLAVLDGPLPAWFVVAALVATPVAAVAMALGRAPRSAATVAAAGFVMLTTYRNSWGVVFHTENLVALHLVVLAAASYCRDRVSNWAVDAMAVLTVGTYLVAGLAKLRIGGTAWLDGDVLRHQIAFDNARKEVLGASPAPFAGWLLRHAWLLGPAAWATMVVELGAPLALLHRRIAGSWAALALGFHIGILGFMAILFPYHLLGLAMAPLLPVERVGTTVREWTERFRRPSTRSVLSG